MNKKICIVQLTRIGDIIQSFQAARQLKLENPKLKLSLIARRDMAKGLIFLLKDVFDDIFLFETSDFFPIGTKSLGSAKDNLQKFLDEVNNEKFDLLVNLSYSSSSSYLCTLVDAEHKMGVERNYKNEISLKDKWSQYIYTNVLDSQLSAFNLVDIYKNILGAKDNHSFPVESSNKDIISIHPFASDIKKRWSMEKWGQLIYKLLVAYPHFEVSILGAKSDEREMGNLMSNKSLTELKHRIKNNVGKLTIEESFLEVSNSKLFLGHDSMMSHMAAIAEKESIIVSLGPVKPFETAPYNDKAITVASARACAPCTVRTECQGLECQQDINSSVVEFLVKKSLSKETINRSSIEQGVNIFSTTNLKVYTSSFDVSGLKLSNVLEKTVDSQTTMRSFLRICFDYYLMDREVEMNIPKLNNEAITTLKMSKDGIEYMYELFHHAMVTCNSILELSNANTSEFKKVKDEIAKLSEIDKLLQMTAGKYKLLAPINNFFFVNRLNSKGKDLVEITQSNLVSYYEAQNFLCFVEDLTNTTLGPKIVDRNLITDV